MDRSSGITKKTDDDDTGRNLGPEEEEENDKKNESIERIFDDKEVPSWKKLNLTTGIIPSLNVSAELLGFFFVKTWTKFLEKSGFLKQPFTRQENTVIQTCVVASSDIAFSGGFGSYLFGMSEVVAKSNLPKLIIL
ncbi:putative metal-nicotianamine transporter ysl5 [Castilleja foliolosa]|uniref:Metal-nicotianamine transporter ysl5 n=1 Tax=Castilleja foliolosa TaxID=1961234 RepID=A0ABD3CJN9_9LAMI